MYIHTLELARKRKKLSSLTTSLWNACKGILAHVEEKYKLPGEHVNSTTKERTAQLSGLLTEKSLRQMLEEKNHFAADILFPFVAPLTDRCVEFKASCDLTSIVMQYNDIVRSALVEHKKVRLVE